jgi:hypothetical protein
MCYMPRPLHSSCFDHPNNIRCRVQIIKLLVMQSFPLPCYFVPPRPKYLPPSVWETKFHTCTKQQTKLYFCVF